MAAVGSDAITAMSVRLWEEGGAPDKLHDFAWEPDGPVATLLLELIRENQGKIAEARRNQLQALFENPLKALSAAKLLQQRLQALGTGSSPRRALAAVTVHSWFGQAAATLNPDDTASGIVPPAFLLGDADPRQILVAESIYGAAKSVPSFEFSSTPVRLPGDSGVAEAMYELHWTPPAPAALSVQDSALKAALGDRYVIQAELGRGMMGVVYKAQDQWIGRTVALKTILLDRSADRAELVERLKQEAKAAGGLDHPNIITIYDVGEGDGLVYLSMQYVEGVTLGELLAGRRLAPLPTLISYAEQICAAVGFAHQRGVIHRDLKPSNLMLTSQGAIKVLDFGIAKFGDAGMTQVGLVVGTPTYMAPEQATGIGVDHRADIFALGAVFYELFTGEKAFRAPSVTAIFYKVIHEDPAPPSTLEKSLPRGIDLIIRRALSKDPQHRFQSCEEMGQAFHEQARLLASGAAPQELSPSAPGSIPARSKAPITTGARAIKFRKSRRPFWIGVTIALLIVAASLASWALLIKSQTGAYPPLVEKLSAAIRNLGGTPAASSTSSLPPATGTDGAGNAPAQNSVDPGSATQGSASQGLANQGSANQSGDAAARDSGAGNGSPVSSSGDSPTGDGAKSQTEGQQKQPTVGAPVDADATHAQNPAGPPSSDQSSPNQTPPARSNGVDAGANGSAAVPRETTSEKPSAAAARKHAKPTVSGDASNFEGFSRQDIPSLLAKADAAAGRGDYPLAKYEYNIILKLDRQNAAAKTGLRRVLEAEKEKTRE